MTLLINLTIFNYNETLDVSFDIIKFISDLLMGQIIAYIVANYVMDFMFKFHLDWNYSSFISFFIKYVDDLISAVSTDKYDNKCL